MGGDGTFACWAMIDAWTGEPQLCEVGFDEVLVAGCELPEPLDAIRRHWPIDPLGPVAE